MRCIRGLHRPRACLTIDLVESTLPSLASFIMNPFSIQYLTREEEEEEAKKRQQHVFLPRK